MEQDQSNEVITFGCRLNIYESEIIKNNLAKSGLKDVVVLNSCAVTTEAVRQLRQSIRKVRRNRPSSKIIVTGCAAQARADELAKMDEIDHIIGNVEKLSSKYYKQNQDRVIVSDIMKVKEIAPHFVNAFAEKSRGFIEVQNGCNHRCTFCLIPYGRGNSRSAPIGEIARQMQILVDNNYKEIVFTGVDVTGYGSDLPGSPTFAQMIRRVLSLVPIEKIRLSSIDVAEIDEELFDLMANEERLQPHFHISAQAGDDIILKRMKRRHLRDDILKFCDKMRSRRKNVSFGADIIAGFPTESDEMFLNTKNMIKEAGLHFLHIFPYSAQNGTPAARMPQVEKPIIKERARQLRQLGEVQRQKLFAANIGRKTNIILENHDSGHTDNFIPIKLDSNSETKLTAGQIVPVKLLKAEQSFVLAQIFNNA